MNTPDTLSAALREGNGIGALPMPSAVPALKSGTLVRVPGHQLRQLTTYVLYPARQYIGAKNRPVCWAFARGVVPQALAADQTELI